MPPLNWKPVVPEHISSLVPYPPGKPIEETKREYGIDTVVKLASNENPLGPSPRSLDAVRAALSELNLYPDGAHYALKQAIARKFGVSMPEVAIGNGSNEFIDLLIRVFVPRECNVVAQEKAFIAYKLCAQLQGCGYREAKADAGLRANVDALLAECDGNTRLVFLANPNNPTGTWLARAEVERLAAELDRRKILLVLDAAYAEYVTNPDIPDAVELTRKFGNVIVLKTFSKIYGLAGLRVGYMIADPAIVSTYEKSRQPFNIGSLGLVAGVAALGDDDFVSRSRKLNAESLASIAKELKKYGLAPVAEGAPQVNFVLVDFKRPAQPLYPEFLRRGVIVRPVGNYGLPNHFRISAGLPEENALLFKALAEVLK